MEQINAYKFNELSEEAQKTALEKFRDGNYFEINLGIDDIIQSLTGLFNACNDISIIDWSLGESNSYIDVSFKEDMVENFTGRRALAWVENNLYHNIRIPYENRKERAKFRKYGKDYYPGKIKPCPFTGMYYDIDFLNDLDQSIKHGLDLKTSFEGLATIAQKLINQLIEYFTSDQYIIETLTEGNFIFLANGHLIF